MGTLTHPSALVARDQQGTPVPFAQMSVYAVGSVNLCPIFSDFHLTVMQQNPVRADANGVFPICYLLDGEYKLETVDRRGKVMETVDDVAVETVIVGAADANPIFATVADVLGTPTLSYTDGEGLRVVSEGDIVSVADGAVSYRVAAAAAGDQHVTTAGGVKLHVLKSGDGALHSRAWGIQTGVDESAKFALALAAAQNGTLVINRAEQPYVAGMLTPAANTRVILEPGTVIEAPAGGSRLLQILNADVHVVGYGAKLVMDGSQDSHGVHIAYPAQRCSVSGVHVKGSGSTGDDCFYIGGSPQSNLVARDIRLTDVIGEGISAAVSQGSQGTRNCLSIVAVDGCVVENSEFFGADTSPGLGIDIEANEYMADGTSAIRNVRISNCRCHDNPNNGGIGVIFGSEVTIENCMCHDNGGWGIGVGAGGTNFDQAVARPGDVLGISDFELATGWITVTDGLAGNLLTDDLAIYEGMYVGRWAVNGATWPSNLTQTNYQIVEIDATQSKVRLGLTKGANEFVSFPGAGTGARSVDPWASDLRLRVYGRPGNNDKIRILGTKCWNNGYEGIEIGTSRGIEISGCDIASGNTGIQVAYVSEISVFGNQITQADGGPGGRGLLVTASGYRSDRNIVRGFTLEGIRLDGVSGCAAARDEVVNCGKTSGYAYRVFNCVHGVFSPMLRSDQNHNPSQGFFLSSGCSLCLAVGLVAKGMGASNASSIAGPANTVWRDCIQRDGTFR